jgi:hypothetical protein
MLFSFIIMQQQQFTLLVGKNKTIRMGGNDGQGVLFDGEGGFQSPKKRALLCILVLFNG